MFSKLRSRILLSVPPKVIEPVKLLACDPKRISEAAAVELNVTAPAAAACVIAPVSVMAPPEVIARVLLPTEEVPKLKTPPVLRETLLAPLLESETLPVKLLPEFAKVMTPALPVKLAAPAEAVCVMEVEEAWVIPIPFTVKVPVPTEILPSVRAPLLKRLTLFAPELLRETAPVKLSPVFAKVNTPALPVKLATPAEAAWVIAVLAA